MSRLFRIPRYFAVAALASMTVFSAGAVEIPLAVSTDYEFISEAGPAAAALADGGFGAVWLAGGFPSRLVMQWVDPDGQPRFEPNGRVIAGADGINISEPMIVAREGGGAFVGFSRLENVSQVNAYVQSFDVLGQPLWPDPGVRVATSSFTHAELSIASDGAGGCYACFVPLLNSRVECQRIGADGARLWGAGGLPAGGAQGSHKFPVTLPDGDGGLLVFWRNRRGVDDGQIDNLLVEGQRFSAPGVLLWGAAGILVRDTELPEGFGFVPNLLAAAGDGDGGAYLSMTARVDDASPTDDVVGQWVSGAGQLPWGVDGVTVVADAAESRHEATLPAADGFVAVISEPAGDGRRIRSFRLDDTGSHLWGAAGVDVSNPAVSTTSDFVEASFDAEVLRVAWTREVDGDASGRDVVLKRIAGDGSPLGAGAERVTDAPETQFCRSLVFSPTPAETFVLWEDFRKGGFDDADVYAALLSTRVIFRDGFEGGDPSSWDVVFPPSGP